MKQKGNNINPDDLIEVTAAIVLDKHLSDRELVDFYNGELKDYLLKGWKVTFIDREALRRFSKIKIILNKLVEKQVQD